MMPSSSKIIFLDVLYVGLPAGLVQAEQILSLEHAAAQITGVAGPRRVDQPASLPDSIVKNIEHHR